MKIDHIFIFSNKGKETDELVEVWTDRRQWAKT